MEPDSIRELTKNEEKTLGLEADKEFMKLSFKDKLNVPGNVKKMVIAILSLDILIAIVCLLLGDLKDFGMVILSTIVFSWLGWFFFNSSIKNGIYFEKKLEYLEKIGKEAK
ncbi:MAG: hypothetical protein NTY68_05705 [Candidatus Micrarchaeota archaeon]|nr:hypothetical protein [Candidatus Micrarchaeota archaeon]